MFEAQKDQAFAYGCAASPNWRDAAGQCLSQIGQVSDTANLGFVYFTDSIASQAREILDYLRVNTGVYHWVGSVGMGVCATGREYYDRPAMAIMLCSFPLRGRMTYHTVITVLPIQPYRFSRD